MRTEQKGTGPSQVISRPCSELRWMEEYRKKASSTRVMVSMNRVGGRHVNSSAYARALPRLARVDAYSKKT